MAKRSRTGVRLGECLLIWIFVFSPGLPARADVLKEYENALGNEARGEYYTAILNLRRCLAENPNYIPAHLLMGDVYINLGKYEEADTAYQTAEEKDPNSVDASTRRLKLYALHMKNFDLAEKLLADVSTRFEQNAEIHYYKALVMVGKHNYLNAKSELQLALALREKFFEARKLQLEIESIIGDPNQIRKSVTVLLSDFPDRIETYDIAAAQLLKIKTPPDQVLELFSSVPQNLLQNPAFGRLLARIHLIAESFDKAAEILKTLPTEGLGAEAEEELTYLKSLAAVATGRKSEGIQILSEFLIKVPDRPYMQLQLDLWLLRYAPVMDPLRVRRAEERLNAGRQLMDEGDMDAAFIQLYLSRKLNPRDKNGRRYLAEAFWQLGLAESARNEINVGRNLDPNDEFLRKRSLGFGAAAAQTDPTKRRTYKLYVFRLSDMHSSLRPGFGRLYTDAVSLFSEALTPFFIQALEPAVPFEKAEEVAHQQGADFFLHGYVGLSADGGFDANFGAFPVGGKNSGQSIEFSEQHVVLKSRSDFSEELLRDTVKAFQRASSQYAVLVNKEREGYMIVDVGRRHGVTSAGQFMREVQGGPLLFDVTQIYEWFSRIRVEEIERARYVGIGDFLRLVKN